MQSHDKNKNKNHENLRDMMLHGWSVILRIQTSFPEVHKVGDPGIFVQLLREINWKQLSAQWVSKRIYIFHNALN